MTRSKRRKKKSAVPATSAWGNFEEALATVDTLDMESLDQVCAEVSRLARRCVAGLPNDDEDYPLPPIIIALAGYFETLALNVRDVWLREVAGGDVHDLADAEKAGVLSELRTAMRVSAAWRMVGALMGQKQNEEGAGDETPSHADALLQMAQATRNARTE